MNWAAMVHLFNTVIGQHKKGLQSADHLVHDIRRIETSYLDKNKREYELTKHVSLTVLDPLALARLRAVGVCDFEIPEALFDLDHAGHYFRRIKSVSVSMPCIAGPYTSIGAKLSLVSNRYRKNTNPDNGSGSGYIEDPGNDDERFVYNVGLFNPSPPAAHKTTAAYSN